MNKKSKTLVVYFSQTGTTEKIAVHIADTLDADIFEILPKITYTSEDIPWHIITNIIFLHIIYLSVKREEYI